MGMDWEGILGCEDGDMLQDYYDANIPEDDEYYEDYEDDYYEDEDENEEYDEENLIFLDDNGYDKNYNGIFRNIHNSDFQESEWPDRGEYLYYMVEDEIHCFDCMREFTAEITVLVDDDANEDEMRNAVKKVIAKGGVDWKRDGEYEVVDADVMNEILENWEMEKGKYRI